MTTPPMTTETKIERDAQMDSVPMTPCPPDHPLMKAWKAYQDTYDYANSYRWATAGIDAPTLPPEDERDPGKNYTTPDGYRQYVVGSLWAAFMAGFAAAGGKTV